MMKNPDMIVTTALYYANGSIHLGHLVETIQADIWVRFQRLQKKRCLFLGGDDAHGTPIMLSSQKRGITPNELIDKIHLEHQEDFKKFYISFDQYHTTHSEENRTLTEMIYSRLQEADMIEKKTIHQAYDTQAKMFLPDRYVKGDCPKCNAPDQYGDACEKCGATYDPLEMSNAISTVSQTKPIEKPSEHYFFKLSKCKKQLKEWLENDQMQAAVTNKLKEWFKEDLKDWDISRDEPYFGFKIPDTDNKYFYVWLDAPIGYIAASKAYAKANQIDLDHAWEKDTNTSIYHFIGKDIIYFHGLFWPAVLNSAQMRMPSALFAHGFLTINGKKMSKSRGTFITAHDYLKHFEAEHLRYYLASKLNSKIEDIDLNWEDFIHKINVDLVGKIINIASRTAKFLDRDFEGKLYPHKIEHEILKTYQNSSEEIATLYQAREFSQVCRKILFLADITNQYIAKQQPWNAIKETDNRNQVHQTCTIALLCFRDLSIFLKPILPILTNKIEDFLNLENVSWDDLHQPLLGHKINTYKHLIKRIPAEAAKHFETSEVA